MIKQETFVEQMIKRGTSKKDLVRRLCLVGGDVLILLILIAFGYNAVILVGPVLIVVLALMTWILWRRVAQEFEYIFTEGNLDIDVIFSRSTRKHLFSVDCRKAVIIAPYASKELENVLPGYHFDKTIYAIEDKPKEGDYGIVAEYLSKQCLVYFTPDEKLLAHIKQYAPKNSVIRQEDLDKVTPNYWEQQESKKKKNETSEEEEIL